MEGKREKKQPIGPQQTDTNLEQSKDKSKQWQTEQRSFKFEATTHDVKIHLFQSLLSVAHKGLARNYEHLH